LGKKGFYWFKAEFLSTAKLYFGITAISFFVMIQLSASNGFKNPIDHPILFHNK